MARPSRQPAPSLQAANYLAGQTFYQVVRLGISKYDVSSHDDRYAHLSTQHDKSHEWDASGGGKCNGCRQFKWGDGPQNNKELGEEEGSNSQIHRQNQGPAWRQSRSRPVSKLKDPSDLLGMEPLTTCKCHRSEQLEDPSRWAVIPASVARLASPRVSQPAEC